MGTIKLAHQQAIDLAEMVVEEFGPDHVYQRDDCDCGLDDCGSGACNYFRNNQPSCIVGQTLHRMGVAPFEEYSELNECGIASLCMGGTPEVPKSYDETLGFAINCDPETAKFLVELQNYQDDGHTWGLTLFRAKMVCGITEAEDTGDAAEDYAEYIIEQATKPEVA